MELTWIHFAISILIDKVEPGLVLALVQIQVWSLVDKIIIEGSELCDTESEVFVSVIFVKDAVDYCLHSTCLH